MKSYAAFTAVVLLAACQPAAETSAEPGDETGGGAIAAPASENRVSDPYLVLDAEGLRVIEAGGATTRLLAFGAPREEILSELSSVFRDAPPEEGHLAECGVGPLDFVEYGDELTVYFSDGAFAGWLNDGGSLATADQMSADSTRSDLEALGITEFTRDTLGTEFEHNGVYGMLAADDEEVDLLWAGVNCFFR